MTLVGTDTRIFALPCNRTSHNSKVGIQFCYGPLECDKMVFRHWRQSALRIQSITKFKSIPIQLVLNILKAAGLLVVHY